jgi:sensor domain CHASE-containing protein
MTSKSQHLVRCITQIALLCLVASCATTINESATTTIASTQQETTQITVNLTLTRDELLAQMLQSINKLSDAMQKADRKAANLELEQITLLSSAVRPEILQVSDQLAADFDRVVALAQSSVERNRPADADKALRFLPLVIESLKNF